MTIKNILFFWNTKNIVFIFRNRDNIGKNKRYLHGVVEKLGHKTIPDFKSLKNQGMYIII